MQKKRENIEWVDAMKQVSLFALSFAQYVPIKPPSQQKQETTVWPKTKDEKNNAEDKNQNKKTKMKRKEKKTIYAIFS